MILTLAAVRHGDETFSTPITTRLGPTCVIGRGRECDLVLEDPTRHVSRRHAVVTRRGDSYVLSVESRLNPVIVNGRPVNAGEELELGSGDVLLIGEYELNVVPDDGITSLLGVPTPSAKPPAGGALVLDELFGPAPDQHAPARSPGAGRIDELLTPQPGTAAAVDPLADLLGSPGAASGGSRGAASEDPLLSLLGGADRGQESPITPANDIGRALEPSHGVSSIDDLLGGAGSVRSDPLGLGMLGEDRQNRPGYGGGGHSSSLELDHVHDVNLPVSLPQAPAAAPPRPARPAKPPPSAAPVTDDPLAALLASAEPAPATSPRPAAPPASDDPLAAILGADQPAKPAPQPARAKTAPTPPTSAEEDPLAALLGSPAEPGTAADPSVLFSASPTEAPVAAPQQFVETTIFSVDEDVPTTRTGYASPAPLREVPTPAPKDLAPPAPAAAPRAAARASAHPDALRGAVEGFLAGAGMKGVQIPDDQVEAFLQECGATVRAAVEGIMGMLLARAKVREELRASDRTMVAARENNALKLIETVEEALQYVFDPATRTEAFLPPPTAITDACADLQAHEIALVAGMRAALMGSLKKFEPSVVEKKLEKEGGKSLLANKKAQLWDRFVAYHDELSKEAEDNFDRVFGIDFLRTYTEQVRRLRAK